MIPNALKPYLYVGICIAIAVLLYTIRHQSHVINALRQEVATVTAVNAGNVAAIKDLEAALKDWQDKAVKATAAAVQAVKDAEAVRLTAMRDAAVRARAAGREAGKPQCSAWLAMDWATSCPETSKTLLEQSK